MVSARENALMIKEQDMAQPVRHVRLRVLIICPIDAEVNHFRLATGPRRHRQDQRLDFLHSFIRSQLSLGSIESFLAFWYPFFNIGRKRGFSTFWPTHNFTTFAQRYFLAFQYDDTAERKLLYNRLILQNGNFCLETHDQTIQKHRTFLSGGSGLKRTSIVSILGLFRFSNQAECEDR